MTGTKQDGGKLRWLLLPFGALELVVRVLEFGAHKYAVDNWKIVADGKRRYADAALRHFVAWRRGEANDPESGLPHLAHAACCMLFLLAFDQNTDGAGGGE